MPGLRLFGWPLGCIDALTQVGRDVGQTDMSPPATFPEQAFFVRVKVHLSVCVCLGRLMALVGALVRVDG